MWHAKYSKTYVCICYENKKPGLQHGGKPPTSHRESQHQEHSHKMSKVPLTWYICYLAALFPIKT